VKKNRLYIYLARLDKKGIEVVTAFESPTKVYPTRIREIAKLGLEKNVAALVISEYSKKKMTHEIYAESAESFDGLRKSLGKRGYHNLPLNQFTGPSSRTKINKEALVTERSTMTRRASSVKR